MSFASIERARRAAETRLAEAAWSVPWLGAWQRGQDLLRAHQLVLENTAFWRALLDGTDPMPVLLQGADVYMAAGMPGWAEPVVFFAGINEVNSNIRRRLKEIHDSHTDVTNAIEHAISLHDQGRFRQAIDAYDQVLNSHPGSGWARCEKLLSLATVNGGKIAGDTAIELCREAQRHEPFFRKAWEHEERGALFATAVAPAVYDGARDRPGLARLAHGLQILEFPGLAALVWSQLLRREPENAEIRGSLSECLISLGLEDVLDARAFRDPVPARSGAPLQNLRRAVSSLRGEIERKYHGGRADLAGAKQLLEAAERLGENDIEVVLAHNLLGAMQDRMGRSDVAEGHLRAALRILEATVLSDDVNLITTLHNLAVMLMNQHRYPEARELLQRGLNVATDAATRAFLLTSLAGTELGLRHFDEAEIIAAEATREMEQAGNPNQEQKWHLLQVRADIARDSRKRERAIELLEQLLELRNKALGADDVRLAFTQNNLAMLYEDQGSVERAESLLRQSLDVRRRALGPSHPDVATAENNLGLLLARQRRFEEARSHIGSALELRRRGLSKDNPLIPVTLVNLAQIETASGARHEAIEHLDEALGLDLELRGRLSRGRTELERSNLKAEVGARIGVVLWTALGGESTGAQQDLAAECILSLKEDSDRAAVPRSPEYRGAARALSSLLLGGPRGQSAAEYRAGLDGAQAQLGKLEQAEPDQGRNLLAVNRLAEVRSALGDRILLDYVHMFPPENLGAEAQVAQYAVLVLGESIRRVIPLGPCERIDRLVRRFRETMDDAPALAASGERAAEARLHVISKALCAELFEPVRTLIGKATRVIVAPDYRLHLVPWSALVGADERYLVEDFEFAMLASGCDILREDAPPAQGGAVCAFVDPDFDLEPPEVAAKPTTLHYSRASQHLASVQWPRLRDTRDEARAIAEALPGENVQVFADADATEAALFALRSPRILHLSTHGFFLDRDELPPLSPDAQRPYEVGVPAVFGSGLVLAGANTIGRRPASGVTDKGLVSALELSTLDLSGTELVVLSGCETAVGAPIPGEGVLGLRRAFQRAGAKQLVSSLWKVPESESAMLFGHFYRHIGNGEGPTTALRNASLELIAERRAAHGAAHPLYWGGFIAIGCPRRLAGLGVLLPMRDGERIEIPLQENVRVIATAHVLSARTRLPVVTLITQGLADLGGQEVGVTVMRAALPSTGQLLGLLSAAYVETKAGNPPAIGDLLAVTAGAEGLLGFSRFKRALVWHPHPLAGVPESKNALSLQMLTSEEAQNLDQLGPLRYMARLGQSTSFYPNAPWVDPERKSLIEDGDRDSSILHEVRSARLKGARISRISRADREGLSISLPLETAERLDAILGNEDSIGVSLLGHEDAEADGILVWHADAPLSAIAVGSRKPTRLALNFVALVKGNEEDLFWAEDGAVCTLDPERWAKLRRSVVDRKNYFTEIGERPVRLEWISAVRPSDSVRLIACQLITPAEDLDRALTHREAAGIVERTIRAVDEGTKGVGREPLGLLVQMTLEHTGGITLAFASTMADADDVYQAVGEAMSRQSWPLLPAVKVELAMHFALFGWEAPAESQEM